LAVVNYALKLFCCLPLVGLHAVYSNWESSIFRCFDRQNSRRNESIETNEIEQNDVSVTHLLSLQNDKDYEYLNKTVRDGRGRFLEMADLDMFTLVKNS
jgi:hypothetical protein